MRILKLTTLLALPAMAMTMATTAQAGPPAGRGPTSNSQNCWGVVSSQLAHVEGGIGEHSSSQTSPRLGLGNVARLFYDLGLIENPSVSDLGSLLAELDEYDETACPIQ